MTMSASGNHDFQSRTRIGNRIRLPLVESSRGHGGHVGGCCAGCSSRTGRDRRSVPGSVHWLAEAFNKAINHCGDAVTRVAESAKCHPQSSEPHQRTVAQCTANIDKNLTPA